MRLAFDIASAVVIAAVAVCVVLTFRDYGITWDEPWHWAYGNHIAHWFETGGADRSALSYRADYLYGGAFDLLAAWVRRASPESIPHWQTQHLLGAMVGVLGLVGTWRLARHLGGPAAGLAATLMLATTPVYYGHMFNNPKDVPFAVGYVWAVHALCIVAARLPAVRRRDWLLLSVATGLAMGVRVGGLLILCYLVAVVAWVCWQRARQTQSLRVGLDLGRHLGLATAGVIAGAWAVMLAPWPWALGDPLRRPVLALGQMTRYLLHERTMPFAGAPMRTTEPRWDYLVHYFGLKLPLLLLVLAAVGLGVAALGWRARQRGTVSWDGRGRAVGVLGLATLFPPLYAATVGSVLYDGLRHFLFVVPLLAVAAGCTVVLVTRWVAARWLCGRSGAAAAGTALVVGGLCGRTVVQMVALHPHQYVYFNELAGGLAGASGNYDTDYYGNAYKEGFGDLADYLWRTEPDAYLNHDYVLSGCIPDVIAYDYLKPGFQWRERDLWRRPPAMANVEPDFYLGYTRADCDRNHADAPEVLRVQRDGALLLRIRDRRSPATAQPVEPPPEAEPGRYRGRRRGATWDKPSPGPAEAR